MQTPAGVTQGVSQISLHFSETEFARRKLQVQAAMAKAGLDSLLLFNPSSQYWLTGYDTFGYCFFQCLIFTQDGRTSLLTRSADLRQAQLTSNIADVRIWQDADNVDPSAELRKLLVDLSLHSGRFGVEFDTHGLTAMNARRLETALAGWQLTDASRLVSMERLRKSDEELTYVRRAGVLGDLALDAAIEQTRPGADEGEILAAMHHAIFAAGGDYPGNPFIIGSGPSALLCRYKSGRRQLSQNDQLTLEWAGVERHYHAASMRTLVVGEPVQRQIDLFSAAKQALEACEQKLRAGRTFDEVYKAHARTLDAHGLASHRLNACGYSLGSVYAPSWMDWPMFYEGNQVTIEPGMVLFLHMIIMDSDAGLAMCLGRTSITTPAGAEALSRYPLELICR